MIIVQLLLLAAIIGAFVSFAVTIGSLVIARKPVGNAAVEAAPKGKSAKARRCPACGADQPPGNRFCGACGAPLLEDK